jgi:hypothetical protein
MTPPRRAGQQGWRRRFEPDSAVAGCLWPPARASKPGRSPPRGEVTGHGAGMDGRMHSPREMIERGSGEMVDMGGYGRHGRRRRGLACGPARHHTHAAYAPDVTDRRERAPFRRRTISDLRCPALPALCLRHCVCITASLRYRDCVTATALTAQCLRLGVNSSVFAALC